MTDADLIPAETRAPVQCAPPLGVHQGCEHAEQSRPTAHFTIDADGTCGYNLVPIDPRNRILSADGRFVTVACGPWAPMPTRPRSHPTRTDPT